jgi:hypothetical protein
MVAELISASVGWKEGSKPQVKMRSVGFLESRLEEREELLA